MRLNGEGRGTVKGGGGAVRYTEIISVLATSQRGWLVSMCFLLVVEVPSLFVELEFFTESLLRCSNRSALCHSPFLSAREHETERSFLSYKIPFIALISSSLCFAFFFFF